MSKPQNIPLVLPLKLWPTLDQHLWEGLFTLPDDWGAGGGAGWSWRQGSRDIFQQSYAQWLSYLKRCHPELLLCTPADRTKIETVKAYIEDGRTRYKSKTQATHLGGLYTIIDAFAPEQDWSWIQRASRNFDRKSGSEPKTPLPPITAQQIHGILAQGLSLMQSQYYADAAVAERMRHAVKQRDHLMLALLIHCPVRVRALLSMTPVHIIPRDGTIWLKFSSDEIKNGRAQNTPLPPDLVPHIEDYLCLHRPTLLRHSEATGLWISQRGNAISQDSLSRIFKNSSKRIIGYAINPHMVRHIIATALAEDMASTAVQKVIADVLGHATLQTAEKHYIRASGIRASRRYGELTKVKRLPKHKFKSNKTGDAE